MSDIYEGLPPHSEEAEQAVLGSIILNPLALFDVNFLTPDDFFIVKNGWIFEAMLALFERGEDIDNVTVVNELRDRGQLEECGGSSYITYIINHTPSSIYTETYGRIVKRGAIRRRGLGALSEIARILQAESASIDDVQQQAVNTFFAWLSEVHHGNSASAQDIAGDVLREAEDAFVKAQRGETVGLPSGFSELDDLIGGFHKNKFYVVAGRPGMGKTALLLSIVFKLVKIGVPVGVFSLEMSRVEMVRRLIAMDTGISTQTIENGRFTDREFALFVEANDRISQYPFWVNDTPAHNIGAMRAQAKAWYLEHGIKLVIVDYLQLATGNQDTDNRTLEVGSISRGLKQCARELEIPVLAAAQLNRDVEKRAEKRPGLADLRESGDIENDADVVMFVYRDEYYHPNTEKKGVGEVIVSKQRSGPTGSVDLYWKAKQTQFVDIGESETVDYSGYGDGYRNERIKESA